MSVITSKIKTIKRVLDPVARLAPRLKPRLKPMHNILGTRRARTGKWTADGSDPQLLCEFPLLELHTGWYLISVDIECSEAFDVAKFYLDNGDGFNENDVICIPYRSSVVSKRFVKFSRKMKKMRFDPQGVAGEFEINGLTITPVAFKFAESRMLRKLTRWSASRLDETISGTRRILKEIAEKNNTPYESVLLRHYGSLFVAPVESHGYQDWIRSVEETRLPHASDIDALSIDRNKPLLSVIIPTCNTNPDLLRATIASVQAQSYPHWEICLADDASDKTQTQELLAELQSTDGRVKVAVRAERGGIALNTNSALELASGGFCLFLDHDDLLAEHAFYEVASVIANNPDVKLIYSDEDKINNEGQRVEPHFKPDWNPDLLLAQNYICHLCVIRRDLIEKAGRCRTGYEGAQDHDLLLRVTKNISPDDVHHIPQILYHWRITSDSTASSATAKCYSTDSGIAAVSDYLANGAEDATVVAGKYPNTYRVIRNLPDPLPLVSIIIPTRDGLEILSQCVHSILTRTHYANYEIIIVDNNSKAQQTHEYFSKIGQRDNVRIIPYAEEFNYSAINNYAVSQANGTVVTLLNNDVEVISDEWLCEMVANALRPSIGCVGAKLLYKNNMVQHAGVILGIGGVAGHAHKYFDADSAGYFSRLHLTQNMSAVTAACLTVKKSTYEAAGGLNESDLKVAFNDVDFCLRVQALGLRNLWTPYALLYHHESLSRGREDTHEKQVRFSSEALFMQKKWGKSLLSDPAYNRNLTRSREDFSLAA
ncbi:hypothetical protein AB833_30360 [Chromatiales bacterium (ex Bugula neritina AB1)]|nr:hypothetical protein AB833_30360 [Chromatiales bacterium (ex Bugula neritina AB1)]